MNTLVSRRAFVFTLAAMAMVNGLPTQSHARRKDSRVRVMEMVLRQAIDLDVSLSLALAVAHAESNFNALALSSKGARGVMQIMPATARGVYGITADQLWNPRTNIRVGLHFLSRLIESYDGHTDIALSHYNGGSAVRRGGRLRVIPATRKYVTKVKRLQRFYRKKILRGLL